MPNSSSTNTTKPTPTNTTTGHQKAAHRCSLPRCRNGFCDLPLPAPPIHTAAHNLGIEVAPSICAATASPPTGKGLPHVCFSGGDGRGVGQGGADKSGEGRSAAAKGGNGGHVVDLDSMGVGMLRRVKSDPVIKNIIFW